MKIAVKNFLTTLKRYKAASLLNVLGLTLAFAVFYITASQVWYSVSYNHSLSDAHRTYLVSPQWDEEEYCDEVYCLDKIYELLKEYELYKAWRDYNCICWKLKKRAKKWNECQLT